MITTFVCDGQGFPTAHQILSGTVDIVHCESEQKTEPGFLKCDAGQRVSSRDMGTDGSSVGRQETRLLASDLASLKSVQQREFKPTQEKLDHQSPLRYVYIEEEEEKSVLLEAGL